MNSRLKAARVVSRILKNGRSMTSALDEVLQNEPSAREQAFIQALCYGVLRQYFFLEFVLSRLLHKPLKDMEVKALLLIGLYQIEFMRVKNHAAVSETVSAMRRKPWAKSLLNAVLRKYLREQEDIKAAAARQKTAALAHPAWMIAAIEQSWPRQGQRILLANNRQPPMTLRVNLSRCSREDYLALLMEQGISATAPDFCESAVVLARPLPVEQIPGFADGLVSVQDAAAQLAVDLLGVQSGQRVLDVCAAPGGKAAHILEKQPDLVALLAIDVDAGRLSRIHDTLRRLKLKAEVRVGDALAPDAWWDGRLFERILLDAPCSALGVVRRHPDIKVLRRAEDIDELQHLQGRILDSVWPLLAPGGILVYATCSILPVENEWQIAAFVARHGDAEEIPIAAPWGMARDSGRQILPGDSGMDGFYYARIRKR